MQTGDLFSLRGDGAHGRWRHTWNLQETLIKAEVLLGPCCIDNGADSFNGEEFPVTTKLLYVSTDGRSNWEEIRDKGKIPKEQSFP